MSGIVKIHAREIFDSRGNPTVEVDLTTSKGRHYWRYNVKPGLKFWAQRLLRKELKGLYS